MATHSDLLPDLSRPVWLVTGCSTGLGRALASQIQSSGDNLVSTSRDVSRLSYLPNVSNVLKLDLSVTSKASITEALETTIERFGKIDILINNAGYGLFGDTEGVDLDQARAQFETNFWGPVELTRQVVGIMRNVNSSSDGLSGGVVVQVSSFGGWIGFPRGAFYYASKAALELFTESFSREVHHTWGIKFLILEPGGITTEFAGANVQLSPSHAQYQSEEMPGNRITNLLANDTLKRSAWSSPGAVAKATVGLAEQLRRSEVDMPLRLPLGNDAVELILRDARKFCREVEDWKDKLNMNDNGEHTGGKEFSEWMRVLGDFVDCNERV